MEYLEVIIAATVCFGFGAVWYMVLSKQWIDAAGINIRPDGKPEGSSALPYVISFMAMILVAGMMRHTFALSGIDSVGKGFVSGLGIGLFFITPWISINNAYCGRPFKLTAIDGGYAAIGCAIIGTILTLI